MTNSSGFKNPNPAPPIPGLLFPLVDSKRSFPVGESKETVWDRSHNFYCCHISYCNFFVFPFQLQMNSFEPLSGVTRRENRKSSYSSITDGFTKDEFRIERQQQLTQKCFVLDVAFPNRLCQGKANCCSITAVRKVHRKGRWILVWAFWCLLMLMLLPINTNSLDSRGNFTWLY